MLYIPADCEADCANEIEFDHWAFFLHSMKQICFFGKSALA